jgi:hypothetical protein
VSQRRAISTAIAARYRRAAKTDKGRIHDKLCASTGWHRSYARKALGAVGKPAVARPRPPRPPIYDPELGAALRLCWVVLGAPTGKRLAPVLPDLVPRLRRFGELVVTDDTAARLVAISAATIDRRLAADRAAMMLRGRSHTKPGSLLSRTRSRSVPGRSGTTRCPASSRSTWSATRAATRSASMPTP